MTYEELVAAQDKQRTARQFISFLGGAFGDQSMANEDAYAYNLPGQYQSISRYGVGIEGVPISNLQGGGGITLSLPMLLIGALVVYAVVKA